MYRRIPKSYMKEQTEQSCDYLMYSEISMHVRDSAKSLGFFWKERNPLNETENPLQSVYYTLTLDWSHGKLTHLAILRIIGLI